MITASIPAHLSTDSNLIYEKMVTKNSSVQRKGKGKVVLCVTKHHAIKTYCHILSENLRNTWSQTV